MVDLIVFKNGGSFHGYVSHNQMVKKIQLGLTRLMKIAYKNRWFTSLLFLKMVDLIVLKNGGSFHGYVSHNQMVKKIQLGLPRLMKTTSYSTPAVRSQSCVKT